MQSHRELSLSRAVTWLTTKSNAELQGVVIVARTMTWSTTTKPQRKRIESIHHHMYHNLHYITTIQPR